MKNKKILYILFSLLILLTACGKGNEEDEIDYTHVDEEVVEDTGSIEIAKEFLDLVVKGDKENALKLCDEVFYEDAEEMIAYYQERKATDENYTVEFTDFKEEFHTDRTSIDFMIKSTYKGKYLEENASLHFMDIDGKWMIDGR